MMRKTDIKTETYFMGDGFFIDIVDTGAKYEAYLYRNAGKPYGMKMFMESVPKYGKKTYEEFVDSLIFGKGDFCSTIEYERYYENFDFEAFWDYINETDEDK